MLVRTMLRPRSSTAAPVAPPQEETLGRTAPDLEQPCSVVCHDDPITTMDFVVEVLRGVFGLTQARAYERMLRVHATGAAVIGSWPRSEARALIDRATSQARARGFPLTFSLEE
jgi:ATP-dependent Clp protease adaptor protein ClpS